MQTITETPGAVTSGLPSLPSLFLGFLRLGATAFGGPAMVAYIKELAVRKRGWIDERDFQGGVALCQTIPGATAMQTAAYVGLRARGFLGGLATYVGFGLPAFCLMLALTRVYRDTRSLPVALALFAGLRAVVVALVANAACNFAKSSVGNWRSALLAGAAALALVVQVNPILVIGACASFGAWLLADRARPGGGAAATRDTRAAGRWMVALTAAAAAAIVLLFLFDRRLFDLAVTMLRVDLVAFGGGFASVPLMQHEVVNAHHWMSAQTFMDGIALGQVTPGPIVITATFAGYLVSGIAGAVVATLSVFFPSFVIVALVAPHFDSLQRLAGFRGATRGALVSFVGLLAAVTVSFALHTSWSIGAVVRAAAAFTALRLKVDVFWVVLGGVLLSLLLA
jgi:chromate transporter